MDRWTIDYYCEKTEAAILKLPAGILARYLHLADLIEEFGPNLGMPHTRSCLKMNHKELKQKSLSDKKVKEQYDELSVEFSILRQFLAERKKTGLTQAGIAERMGTKAPAITRLESSLASGTHSPSLTTLEKYAKALGCQLSVKLVRI